MESHAILVAIMFVTILGMGIANLIMSLAAIVNRRKFDSVIRMMVSWIALLLLIHLKLFWQTLIILQHQEWIFSEFLLLILGPILLYFASQILLTDPSVDEHRAEKFSRQQYDVVAQRFFSVLFLLMAWSLVVEFVLGDGVISRAAVDFVWLVLFGVLASVKGARAHNALTIVAWILISMAIVLQGMKIII